MENVKESVQYEITLDYYGLRWDFTHGGREYVASCFVLGLDWRTLAGQWNARRQLLQCALDGIKKAP